MPDELKPPGGSPTPKYAGVPEPKTDPGLKSAAADLLAAAERRAQRAAEGAKESMREEVSAKVNANEKKSGRKTNWKVAGTALATGALSVFGGSQLHDAGNTQAHQEFGDRLAAVEKRVDDQAEFNKRFQDAQQAQLERIDNNLFEMRRDIREDYRARRTGRRSERLEQQLTADGGVE